MTTSNITEAPARIEAALIASGRFHDIAYVRNQLLDLAPSGPYLHAAVFLLSVADGHRGMRRLVRVDADHHAQCLAPWLAGLGSAEGTPAFGSLCTSLSHTHGAVRSGPVRSKAGRLTPSPLVSGRSPRRAVRVLLDLGVHVIPRLRA